MGVTQSLQRIETFYTYHKLVHNNQSIQKSQYQLYFGPQFQIYSNKFNPKQQFTKHTIVFKQLKEMQNFVGQVKVMKDNKSHLMPFNIFYPVNIFLKNNDSLLDKIPVNCGQSKHQLILIHKWLGNTLHDFVKQNQLPLNQQSVWFIVNQLSKSLQILEENNHASFHITPQNIWHNLNHNWFIYDGRYVIGPQSVQQFYQQKLKHQHFMSEEMKQRIQTNMMITNNDSLQQDVYCLGYCIIFMITGIHPKEMPQKPQQRQTFVQQLLQMLLQKSLNSTQSKDFEKLKNNNSDQVTTKYSTQLISLIKNLIKPDPKRRFTIRHIRSYLKSKQQQIFMREEEQWTRSQQEKTSSRHKINFKRYGNLFNSPNLKKYQSVKSPQRQSQKRIMTQHSEGGSNFASMRTLKKQPIPQRMVMINSKDLKRPVFSNLIENDGKNNKLQKSGHFSPIQRMEESTAHKFHFQSIQKINKVELANSNCCDRIPQQIQQIHSPQKIKNQLAYVSPQKQSNSSINTKALAEPIPHYQNSLSHNFASKPQYIMRSPSHYQNVIFSPNKVKVTNQSPQRK